MNSEDHRQRMEHRARNAWRGDTGEPDDVEPDSDDKFISQGGAQSLSGDFDRIDEFHGHMNDGHGHLKDGRHQDAVESFKKAYVVAHESDDQEHAAHALSAAHGAILKRDFGQ